MQFGKETFERERKKTEKNLSELTDDLINYKLKYQLEVAEKDSKELKFTKKIKILNYQIKLYEEQIRAYNKAS